MSGIVRGCKIAGKNVNNGMMGSGDRLSNELLSICRNYVLENKTDFFYIFGENVIIIKRRFENSLKDG